MAIELATLTVNAGQEVDFESAITQGKKILLAGAGCRSVMLARGVESPNKYILQIEWDSVDAHIAFTTTDGMTKFRSLVGVYFAQRPHMEHFLPIT